MREPDEESPVLPGIIVRSEDHQNVMKAPIYFGAALMSVIFVFGFIPDPNTALGMESAVGYVKRAQVFHSPDPDVLDGFGTSVAGHHKRVLVGAPHEVHNGREAGRAYVFDRKSGQILHALGVPNPRSGALFGQAVALNAHYAAVGAPRAPDGKGTYTGSVYLYDQRSGNPIRTIANPNSVTGAFGHTVAMEGNLLIVGDPQASTETVFYTGAVYAFDVTTGERLLTLHPLKPIPGKQSGFGHAVAVSDSIIIIGAPHDHIESIPAGKVYGFNSTTGALVQTYPSPHLNESFFGWSVAVAKDILVVGAFGKDGKYREEGMVYVFDVESGKLMQSLHNPDPREGSHFGKAVAMVGNFLVVGAPGDPANEMGVTKGAVYVFDLRSGKFFEKIVNPETPSGADDIFGAALGAAAGHLLIGAPFGGSDTELDAGLVYEYEFNKDERSRVPSRGSDAVSASPPHSQ